MRVYDYRTDICNVFVSAECRSRFMTLAPGKQAALHSHDLGHEIFLVLQGVATFLIAGETGTVAPGQLVVARRDEVHSVANHGSEVMTMYLSVTPHIHPTHTGREENGDRKPYSFPGNATYDDQAGADLAIGALIDRHLAAGEALQAVVASCTKVQREQVAALRAATAGAPAAPTEVSAAPSLPAPPTPPAAADLESARLAMWDALYPVFKQSADLAAAWNALAPRITEQNAALPR
jgi:quercetin dioxygenase-like cupin family protein